MKIADFYKAARQKYAKFESGGSGPDVGVLRYQVPGGMLSNLVNQLREQHALDRYRDVTDEIPRVRADLGYPPLVTPTSQIVGTQATFNVLTGKRYGVIINEVKEYLKGMYGQTPAPVNEEVQHMAIGDETPITCRPADLIAPEMPKAAQELGDLAQSEEDVISYAIFGAVTKEFLQQRKAGGLPASSPTVAAIAALVANKEGLLTKPAVEEKERPQLQMAVTPSGWRTAGRPRVRQVGGTPKW